jgi:hypothetical protein
MTRMMSSVLMLLLAGGCALGPQFVPAASEPPEPAYDPVGSASAEAWDAVIDVLADFGVDFDFISPEMRFAKISGRLASGPLVIVREPGTLFRLGEADTIPSPDAVQWADCGTLKQEPVVGWGDLYAEFSIRVRDDNGRGIVKVVVPHLWQIGPGVQGSELRRFPCVSRGTFEQLLVDRVQDRVVPRIRQRASGTRER